MLLLLQKKLSQNPQIGALLLSLSTTGSVKLFSKDQNAAGGVLLLHIGRRAPPSKSLSVAIAKKMNRVVFVVVRAGIIPHRCGENKIKQKKESDVTAYNYHFFLGFDIRTWMLFLTLKKLTRLDLYTARKEMNKSQFSSGDEKATTIHTLLTYKEEEKK